METWKHGNIDTLKHGNMETWKHENKEQELKTEFSGNLPRNRSLSTNTVIRVAPETASSDETAAKSDTAAASNGAEPKKLSDLFKNTRLQFF